MLKKIYLYLALLGTIVFTISCSKDVNNAFTRFHHNLHTYYNTYFNQKEYFRKGMDERINAYVPNYNFILPVYIPVDESNKKIGEANIHKSITKGIKAISEHSIKAKPDYDKSYNKLSKSEKKFYDKNEFSAFIDECHLYMGNAYFQLNELDSAELQYHFITVEYPNNPTKYNAYLQLAKISIKRKNFDQAEQYLGLANHKSADNKTIDALPGCYAHLYVKSGNIRKSVTHFKAAILKDSETTKLEWLYYSLAKIYDVLNKKELAYEYFTLAADESSNYELIFNSELSKTVLHTSKFNYLIAKETLFDMLDDYRNIDYDYKIFHYLGELEFDVNNLPQAVENYKYSLKSNKNDNIQKIQTAIKLGNIFFNNNDFFRALQSYEIAASSITKDNPEYETILEKTNTLNRIAKLSNIAYKNNRKKNILLKNKNSGGLLDDVILKLKEKREDDNLFGAFDFTDSDKWYFYNKKIVSIGIKKFQETWGDVKLQDNWRMSNKDDLFEMVDDEIDVKDTIDLHSKKDTVIVKKDIIKNVELKIPVSDALIELADIYNYRIDFPKKSFDVLTDHVKLFPNSSKNPYIYYQLYMLAKKLKLPQTKYRLFLIKNYPNHIFTKVVKSKEENQLVFQNIEKLEDYYDLTYKLFKENNYSETINNVVRIDKENNKFIDKFNFLKLVSELKLKRDTSQFTKDLSNFINVCKDTTVQVKARFLYSAMRENKNSSFINEIKADSVGEKNNNKLLPIKEENLFTFSKSHRHIFVIIIKTTDKRDINLLKFELNTFNIEEAENIDLLVNTTYLGNSFEMISIGAFKNMKNSCVYFKEILNHINTYKSMKDKKYVTFVISQENLVKMIKDEKINEYLDFFYEKYDNLKF